MTSASASAELLVTNAALVGIGVEAGTGFEDASSELPLKVVVEEDVARDEGAVV
jgi:hypothetical protein